MSYKVYVVEYPDLCDMICAICDRRPFPVVYRALPPSTTMNVPQDWQCSWLVQRSTNFLFSRSEPGRCFFFHFLLFIWFCDRQMLCSV